MTSSPVVMRNLTNELIKIFEKREANKQLGRTKCSRENITKGFLKQYCMDVDLIHVAQDRVQ
jgi:hypothetical protein